MEYGKIKNAESVCHIPPASKKYIKTSRISSGRKNMTHQSSRSQGITPIAIGFPSLKDSSNLSISTCGEKNKKREKHVTLPAADIEKGILNLVNRGIITSESDITSFMQMEPRLMISEAAPIYPNRCHSESRKIMTNADCTACMTNFKMDIIPVEPEVKKKSPLPRNLFVKPKMSIYTIGSHDQAIPAYPPAEATYKGEEEIDHVKMKEDVVSDVEEDSAEPRGYAELLDQFSLHNVIIRKGNILSSTPEYISFQRKYKAQWKTIEGLLKLIEKLMQHFKVPFASVDGKKLADLAYLRLMEPSVDQLLECLTNYDEVCSLLKKSENIFEGENGMNLAAIYIQKYWKGYISRKKYIKLLNDNTCAKIIQERWKIARQFIRTRRKIEQIFQQEEEEWRRIMHKFCKNWNEIKKSKRTIVHIPSISCSSQFRKNIDKFMELQNSQLMRLIDLSDENIDILYISPFPIEDEAMQYIYKLLQIGGVKNIDRRVKILHPENYKTYEGKLSLSTSVLFSPRTMKHIKTIIMGKQAYIVPGVIGKADFQLAVKLKLPLLGADPSRTLAYTTKSGGKRILSKSDLNFPPSSYDLYEEGEILLHLSKKIIEYPEYSMWIIKIDSEFGGRGSAYIDTSSIKCLSDDERKATWTELERKGQPESYISVLRDQVFLELREFISAKVKFSSHVYATWKKFISAVKLFGAVVEAVPSQIIGRPSVNMYIEPNGNIVVGSVQETLTNPLFSVIGAAFPQMGVPEKALIDAATSVARICVDKGIIGYLSVDFVAFVNENSSLKIWAVDIDLRLTDNALHHYVFDSIMTGIGNNVKKLNTSVTSTNSSFDSITPPLRSYVYCGLLRHPSFSSWRQSSFFAECRKIGISFDIQTGTGTLFQLVDILIRGVFGVLCVGKSPKESIAMFSQVIEFIRHQTDGSHQKGNNKCSNLSCATQCAHTLLSKCLNQ